MGHAVVGGGIKEEPKKIILNGFYSEGTQGQDNVLSLQPYQVMKKVKKCKKMIKVKDKNFMNKKEEK